MKLKFLHLLVELSITHGGVKTRFEIQTVESTVKHHNPNPLPNYYFTTRFILEKECL
jgi:hypothetical protein